MFKMFKIKNYMIAAAAVVALTLCTMPTAKSNTIGTLGPATDNKCKMVKAEAYAKKHEAFLTLETEEEQKRFHEILLGKPPQNFYDKVEFYGPPTSPVTVAVLYTDGCISATGRIPTEVFLKAVDRYKGAPA